MVKVVSTLGATPFTGSDTLVRQLLRQLPNQSIQTAPAAPSTSAAPVAASNPAAPAAVSAPAAPTAATAPLMSMDIAPPSKPASRCVPILAKKQVPPPVFLRDKALFIKLSKSLYDAGIKYDHAINLGETIKIIPNSIDAFRKLFITMASTNGLVPKI
ncbi:unnamed protein product [Parnassius mnemosyne]|uniref:Uncharacterized protein n=1 Tax=Parnassius mnemosyne TaxID=213953 RepID=A0AAV1KPA4_9NEOP